MTPARRRRVLLWCAPLAGAALAVLLYSSTGHDDCHITFWAAWSLAEHGEIVNYGGERLEQSSSLLHTLVLAFLYRISGAPLPWLGYLLGIACAGLAAVRLRALAAACGWSAGIGLTLFAATCPAFAYWQLGKLESSLFTWCAVEFAIALVRLLRGGGGADGRLTRGSWARLALATLALAAARPEGALVAAAVGLALAILARVRGGVAPARPALATAIALGALLALVAFRQLYFGQAFPHPVMAKLGGEGGSLRRAAMGLDYLAERLTSAGGGLLLAGFLGGLLLALRDLRERRLERLVPVLLAGAYLSFVVLAGGDWMNGWRFVAHVEPILGLLLFGALASIVPDPAPRRLAALVLVAVNVVGMAQLGMRVSTGRPLWTSWQTDRAVAALAGARPLTWPERANMVHSRDVLSVAPLVDVLGRLLESRDRVSVLSKQGGLLAFYAAREHSGGVELLDPMGLVSDHYHRVRDELDIPSDQLGLSLGIQDVLWLGERRDEPMFHPDVIFDIGTSSAWYVSEHGYVLVYEQTGTARATYTTLEELGRGDADATVAEGAPPMQGHRARMTRPLWTGEWSMYQYIAVREELVGEVGLTSVRDARRAAPPGSAAAPGFLDWDQARLPYLRFFGGELPELPGAGSFVSSGEASYSGRQMVDPDPTDRIPGNVRIATVEVVDAAGRRRLLQEERDYSLKGQGTDRARVLLKVPAGVVAGERIEVRGTTSAPGEHRATIEFKKSGEGGQARERE